MRKRALYLVVLIVFVTVTACNPARRAVRKMNRLKVNHPELFKDTVTRDTITKTDTMLVILSETLIDTQVTRVDTFRYDTIIVKEKKVETTVFIEKRDTLVKYRIRTKVEADTITVIQRDTLIKEVQTQTITTEYKQANKWPWIFGALAVLAILFFIISRRKKPAATVIITLFFLFL